MYLIFVFVCHPANDDNRQYKDYEYFHYLF